MLNKFYSEKEVLMNAHKFGLFQMIWAIEREQEIEHEFPCEVCNASGALTLKTKLQDGTFGTKQVECWYCSGQKVRRDYHTDWVVLGPCQVINYDVNVFPNAMKDGVREIIDGKDYHLYFTYHALAPEGYKRQGSINDGDLENIYLHEGDIFATKEEAQAAAERMNAEARAKRSGE